MKKTYNQENVEKITNEQMCKKKLTKEQKDELYTFLLKPIIVDKNSNIMLDNDNVKSTQKYIRKPDPDMSDIAIEFYKMLYDIDVLDNDGYVKFFTVDFRRHRVAGDTMNSINTITKKFLSKCKEEEELFEFFNCLESKKYTIKILPDLEKYIDNTDSLDKEKFSDHKYTITKLKELKNSYHCLSNFWLIDFQAGRCSDKCGSKDFMDRYLSKIPKNEADKHFISNYYENTEKSKVIEYSNNLNSIKDIKSCVERMIENIEKRANDIAYTDDDKNKNSILYEHFLYEYPCLFDYKIYYLIYKTIDDMKKLEENLKYDINVLLQNQYDLKLDKNNNMKIKEIFDKLTKSESIILDQMFENNYKKTKIKIEINCVEKLEEIYSKNTKSTFIEFRIKFHEEKNE